MVDLFEQKSRCEEILDCSTKITAHYSPCFLEEQGREAVWPRGLLISNTEESLLDKVICYWSQKKIMGGCINTGATLDDILINWIGLFCRAKEICKVSDKLIPHLINRRRIRARGDLDCWNMISPMLLAQQSMEKSGAFVRFLEESEFEFLPIVTLLRRLEVHKL